MVLGVVQYLLGAKYLGDAGLRPAPAASPDAGEALKHRVQLIGAPRRGRARRLRRDAPTAAPITVTAGRRRRRLLAADHRPSSSSPGCSPAGDWTPEERKRLYAIVLFFLAAALFWSRLRAGRVDAEPLRRSRHAHVEFFGWRFPSSWFQSLNSLFIIAARAGVRVALDPARIARAVDPGQVRRRPAVRRRRVRGPDRRGALAASGVQVSPMWLRDRRYLLHTFGELCLSPVGLSAMTKLAPARIAGLMMGVWFLATSVGNFIAGRLAGFYERCRCRRCSARSPLFGIVAGSCSCCSRPRSSRLMGEVIRINRRAHHVTRAHCTRIQWSLRDFGLRHLRMVS